MIEVKPGDVLLYAVAIRVKGALAHYYACEIAGSVSDGKTLTLSNEPVTGVRAVYRREKGSPEVLPRRILLARHENDPGEKQRLSEELERIYGPGELVTGIACQCAGACSILKKRLSSYSE